MLELNFPVRLVPSRFAIKIGPCVALIITITFIVIINSGLGSNIKHTINSTTFEDSMQ